MTAKAFHIILLFAVFFSTTGIVVNRHYCQNELKRSSFFFHARSCHQAEKRECHGKGHCSMLEQQEKKNCCDDKSEYFKSKEEKQAPGAGLEPVQIPSPVAVAPPALVIGLPGNFITFPAYLLFKPPIVCDDFQSLLQTYLI